MLPASKRIKNKSIPSLLFTLEYQFTITLIFYNHLNFTIMNNLRNRVQLIGNLGTDPEVKIFDSGKKKVKLALATSDNYRNASGEKVEQTQWHNIVGWGKTADIAEKYLKKGSEIAVEGKIQYRSYEDKNGEKHYITEIVINSLMMLGKNNN